MYFLPYRRGMLLQHTAYSLQHTAYSLQHTAYSLQHTAYSLQHTAYSLQHTAYSIPGAFRRKATRLFHAYVSFVETSLRSKKEGTPE